MPRRLSMLGGSEIFVYGPCFQKDINVSARIAGTNNSFPCTVFNYVSASCIFPPIFKTGEVTLELNPYGISWNYSTIVFLGKY